MKKMRGARTVVFPSKSSRKKKNKSGGNKRSRDNGSQFGADALVYVTRFNKHNPVPLIYVTRFTASGYFYTTSGAGTGDYNWSFKLNSCYQPFFNVTTGITWGNLTPSTYNPAGFSQLLNATFYQSFVVYDTLMEVDITPQSVVDSVICTVTPSTTSGTPATVGAAMAHPFTKQQTFASGRVYKLGDYPLKIRMPPHKFLGIPFRNYLNDTSGNYVGAYDADPPNLYPVVVNIETGDNATLSNPLEVRVRMTYWVKIYALAFESLHTTLSRRILRSELTPPDGETKLDVGDDDDLVLHPGTWGDSVPSLPQSLGSLKITENPEIARMRETKPTESQCSV